MVDQLVIVVVVGAQVAFEFLKVVAAGSAVRKSTEIAEDLSR